MTQLNTTLDVDCYRWMDWFHGGLQFQVQCERGPSGVVFYSVCVYTRVEVIFQCSTDISTAARGYKADKGGGLNPYCRELSDAACFLGRQDGHGRFLWSG